MARSDLTFYKYKTPISACSIMKLLLVSGFAAVSMKGLVT